MDVDVGLLFTCMATVYLGGILQGLVGHGLGVLLLPLLAVLSPQSLPQVVIFLGLPLVTYMAIRERGAIESSRLGWLMAGRILGTMAGLAVLASVDEGVLQFGFGMVILIMVGASTLDRYHVAITSRTSLVAGGISGLMGTTAGAGGPPIALLYSRSMGAELRATMSVVLLFSSLVSLIGVLTIGRVRLGDLVLSTFCFPALLAGVYSSQLLEGRMNISAFRIVVLSISAASGLLVVCLAVANTLRS